MTTFEELLGRKPDKPLFHYTTSEGLLGILKAGSIWASHIMYLNDESEYLEALQICRKIINDKLSSAKGDLSAYYKHVIENISFLEGTLPVYTYISSFCEEEDALTLWRAYGANNSGYALGYDWSTHQEDTVVLAPCIYHDSQKFAILEEKLEEFYQKDPHSLHEEWESGDYHLEPDISDSEIQALSFAANFHFIAAAFKHHAFKDEREWRAIVHRLRNGRPQVHFRTGASCLIPYVTINLIANNNLEMPKIVVGPNIYRISAARAVREYIRSLNQDDDRRSFKITCKSVSMSEAPYRSF